MIAAQAKRTEVAYRALPVDSSSTIKEFLVDPKKYYNKYVLGETVEEDDSKATLIGSLVHCLLLEPDNFDQKYHSSSCPSKPTEKMLEFTEALYNNTMENTNEAGELTIGFEDLAKKAYDQVGFNWKLETVLSRWREGTGETYYDEILRTRPHGLSVVTAYDTKISEDIVHTLKEDAFVGDILTQENTEDIEVLKELQIEGEEYKIWDLPVKGMIDELIINHSYKTIKIYDLKIVWEVINFFKGYYLYRRAYLQTSIYYKLVCLWAKLNGYEDYKVSYPAFIVGDSANFYSPLIYKLTDADIAAADDGFEYGSTYYKGLHEVITDLKWARDMNEWRMNRTNYIEEGVVKFKY